MMKLLVAGAMMYGCFIGGICKTADIMYEHTIPNARIRTCETFREEAEKSCREMSIGRIEDCLNLIERGYEGCLSQVRGHDNNRGDLQ